MRSDTLDRLKVEFSEHPMMLATDLPTSDEVVAASQELGIPFSREYTAFLELFGGAMVGAYPIFGLRPVDIMGRNHWSVVDMTYHFRQDKVPGSERWVVISEDHAGNPVGMDSEGLIWMYDHDFCDTRQLSQSFEQYIRVRCLGLPE